MTLALHRVFNELRTAGLIPLTDALIVNPNDKVEVAEAIQHALHMSGEERVARWEAMSKVLWSSDVSRSAAAFITDLAANKAGRARSGLELAKKRE